MKEVIINFEKKTITTTKSFDNEVILIKDDILGDSLMAKISEPKKQVVFSREFQKTKKRYSLVVEYEVFDTANDNEVVKTKGTLKDAVRLAKTNPAYAVDMLIDLQNEDGESFRPDGDYLYSVQVYPKVKTYDNYETEIEIEE